MSFSMSAVKIQQLHALVALPRPYNRLARVSGHQTAPVSRTHGCPRRRKVPTRNRSLSTTCRPWSVCARARTFCSRGELEVQIIVARVRSVPLRTSREVVTRVHAPNTARARVIRGVDVLVNTAGHRRVAKSSPSSGCPGHGSGCSDAQDRSGGRFCAWISCIYPSSRVPWAPISLGVVPSLTFSRSRRRCRIPHFLVVQTRPSSSNLSTALGALHCRAASFLCRARAHVTL